MIRNATITDARKICKIYNHYIQNTIISFEEQPISVQEMQNRIKKITASYPLLVSEKKDIITGYTYATNWMNRSAYRYSVESTIYLDPGYKGKGIGSELYTSLITELHQHPVHSIIGIITLPNPASVALHEKMGFKKVAHYKEVGWKFNKWIDVGHWELML